MKLDEGGKDLGAVKEIAKPAEKDKEKMPAKGAKGGAQTEKSENGVRAGNAAETAREKDVMKENENEKAKEKQQGENSGMISPESLEAS